MEYDMEKFWQDIQGVLESAPPLPEYVPDEDEDHEHSAPKLTFNQRELMLAFLDVCLDKEQGLPAMKEAVESGKVCLDCCFSFFESLNRGVVLHVMAIEHSH